MVTAVQDTTNQPLTLEQIVELVNTTLTDSKAKNIKTIDVTGVTDVADTVIIASGTSNRHVRAMANAVAVDTKKAGVMPLGIEGTEEGEWVLVDLVDVVVHLMIGRMREHYDLEGLWLNPKNYDMPTE